MTTALIEARRLVALLGWMVCGLFVGTDGRLAQRVDAFDADTDSMEAKVR